jgi:hypothetical protein
MRIPMRGAVGSLNAAVAGSILLFEAVGQRGLGERTVPPAKRRSTKAASAATSAQPAEGAENAAEEGAEPPASELVDDATPADDRLPDGPPVTPPDASKPA